MFRYIPGIYIRISTWTGVSCPRQFLAVVESRGIQPDLIRSDQGTETMMMASAHWRLHQAMQPNIVFHDVWRYGTPTLYQCMAA